MTDRELLGMAAKAAGMQFKDREMLGPGAILGLDWNPLRDDGDALRLAAKLRLDIEWGFNSINVRLFNWGEGEYIVDECTEFRDDDPYAATRRAIVRAAAEIGRETQSE